MSRPGDGPQECGKVKVLRRTERAVLVEMEDGDERWIPFSVIHDNSEIYEGDESGGEGELVVKEWFAEKEGIG